MIFVASNDCLGDKAFTCCGEQSNVAIAINGKPIKFPVGLDAWSHS